MHRRFLASVAFLSLVGLSPLGVVAADWPTFHGNNTRQGNDSSDFGSSAPAVAWTSPTLDGQLYAQPLIVGSQVIEATENNTVYSLSAATGYVQWSTHLGAPRTSSKSCGDISTQGITSTPVVDAGNVYIVANIQTSASSFYFDLASLSLATGAVNWQHSIDPPDNSNPSGITWSQEAPYMEDRGALLATGGRIFIPMGGNDGDCGGYHGYVVSYPETGSGTLDWWASSEVVSGDKEGAIWATGGLSQDSAGYIYAGTGNSNQGSSSDPYDYSDGVIKLDPNNLHPGQPYDYFAPSTWYQDNAGDADLGSTTPLQLPNNRVFIVGKSGMGYLLNSQSLGHIGGELAAHQVCNATSDAAFGALAYAIGTAFVGCSDGMAAVQIAASSDDFSTLWYDTNNVADHPPTVAGGIVWAVDSAGGRLDGFSPSTGQLVQSLPISGSNHFTTPSAANGQLYVAGGRQVDAFVLTLFVIPTAGDPETVLTPGQGQELIFWRGPSNDHLYEAWYSFAYAQWSGPMDMTATLFGNRGLLASAPRVLFTPGGGQQLVFWQGTDGHLWEAWYSVVTNLWSLRDLTATWLAGASSLASRPGALLTPGAGQQLVFWQGTDGHLWEAWYSVLTSSWSLADLSTGPLASVAGLENLGSAPAAVTTPDGGQQLVFWQGASDDHLWEAWYSLLTSRWMAQDLSATRLGGQGALASSPALLVTPDGGQQLVFWQGTDHQLWEAWYSVGTAMWSIASQNVGSSVGGTPALAGTPDGGQQLVFWQGVNSDLWEAWYSASSHTWAHQDLSAALGLSAGAAMSGPPAAIVFADGEQDIWWQGAGESLWEASFFTLWIGHDWSAP
jgi:polyvinyl alcohol dehydrogenase (cytochrome)